MDDDNISRRKALEVLGIAAAASVVTTSRTEAQNYYPANYSLQDKVEGLKIPSVITVIGCGGFGSWPALFAAMSGVKKIILIDPGDVEDVDLARCPY